MKLRILNLGAGVQSTVLYAMIADGELPPVDCAIFADVGDEPQAVYDHLQFLKTIGGPEIKVVKAGENSLGDNLIKGVNSTGQRHVSIPTFLAVDGKQSAMGRRQCTSEYKIKPIEKDIRRMLGIQPGGRLKADDAVVQIFGLSFDEPNRVARVKDQYRGRKNWTAEFPLFDDYMTRQDCLSWLAKRFPEVRVPRSACVFCPYRSDDEWIYLRDTDPQGFQRAIEIDRAIRMETSACTRGMHAEQFLHRSCQPLELVQLQASPPDLQRRIPWAAMDCEGMCGV